MKDIHRLKIFFLMIFAFAAFGSSAWGQINYTSLDTLTVSTHTGDRPQSKVWKHDGTWWSVLPNFSGTKLWRLDGTSWTEILHLSDSTDVHADVKAIGGITHILLFSHTAAELVSIEYIAASQNYQFWSLRPNSVILPLDPEVETMTIDIDSQGRMWMANDAVNDINVRWSDSPYDVWSAPITLEDNVTNNSVVDDGSDICVVTAFDGKVGVLWSNMVEERFGFRVHIDGDSPTNWGTNEVPGDSVAENIGHGMADDHLNVAVAADGTLYAVVKTSYDTNGYTKLGLLVRRPNGVWDNALYHIEGNNNATRPIVLLNEADNVLTVYYTRNGIKYRETPVGNINFGSTKVLIPGVSLNNVTSTKESFSDEIVILAHNGSEVEGRLGTVNTSANPTIKWVDQANGDDNNDGNSEATAYATLQWAIDQSGSGTLGTRSFIYVKNGDYGGLSQTNQDGNSTAILIKDINYLTIQAAPGHEPAIIPANAGNVISFSIENSANLVIDNIDSEQLANAYQHGTIFNSNDLTIKNSNFEGGEAGILFKTTLTGALFENNTFQDINLTTGGNALDFTYADYYDVTIQDNAFLNNSRPIRLYGLASDNFTIRRNLFDSATAQEAVRMRSASNVLIENNLFTDGAQQGLFIDWSCWNISVLHNTFYQNALEAIRTEKTGSDIVIQNNIINGNGNYAAIASSISSLPGENYNLIFNAGSAVQSSSHTAVDVFGINTIISDPLFISTTAGAEDFHLQQNSPAIAAGAVLATTEDMEKNSRPLPVGTPPDLGAFESVYGDTGNTSAPTVKWVDQLNGNDSNDGNSEATAYATLQHAIDQSNDGENGNRSFIYVKDGSYQASAIQNLDYLTVQAAPNQQPVIAPSFAGMPSLTIANSNDLIIDNIDSDQSNGQAEHFLVSNSDDLIIKNTNFTGGEEGIVFQTTVDEVLIENNTFSNINLSSSGDAIGFAAAVASDVTIQDNIFQNNARPIRFQPPAGSSTNLTIRRNLFDSSTAQEAIRLKSANNVLLENNLFTDGAQQGLYIDWGCANISVLHNTFYENGLEEIRTEKNGSDILIQNNIINANGSYAAIASNASALPGEDYNLIFNAGNNVQSNSHTAVNIFGGNTVIDDPLFVSTTAGAEDFHLQENSAAIAAGAILATTEDMAQNSRPLPAGTAPDLGAFESVFGDSAVVPPATPTVKWVDQLNGSDSNHGNSEATAYATLQYAIDQSNSGEPGNRSLVYVKNGAYQAALIQNLDLLTVQAAAGQEPVITPLSSGVHSLTVANSNELIIDNIDSDQSNGQVNHVVIFNNTNLTVKNSDFSGGEEGIVFQSAADEVLIENNTFTNINLSSSGDAVSFTSTANNITIQDNTFLNNARPVRLNPSGGNASNVTIRRNFFDSSTAQEAVRMKNANDVLVENNLFMHGAQQGVYIDWSCADISVVHNTFYENSMAAIRTEKTGSDIVIQNNIINGNGSYAAIASSVSHLPGEDYNLVFNIGNDVQSNGHTAVDSFGVNTISSDPLFVSTAANAEDFHLQESSPALATGAVLATVEDMEQNSRPLPAGTNPGMGAFEVSGILAQPEIAVNADTLDFGDVFVNSLSIDTVTIHNSGDEVLNINGMSISGTDSSAFSIANNETVLELQPDSSETVVIHFAPDTIAMHNATLHILNDDADENILNIALIGNSIAIPLPQIAVTPSDFHFDEIEINADSLQAFVIHNYGNADLQVMDLIIAGPDSVDFMLISSDSAFTVAPGDSQQVIASFQPLSAGDKIANLTICSNDPANDSLAIQLTGTGTAVEMFVFVADKKIEIDKHAWSEGGLHSNDKIELKSGNGAIHTGNLSAVDEIKIEDDYTVNGDLNAGEKIELNGDPTINGIINDSAAVANIPMPNFNFSAGNQEIDVRKNRTRNLAPGAYKDVKVNEKATLILSAGDYFMKKLEMKEKSSLSVDVSAGPVTINITDELKFEKKVAVEITPMGEGGSDLLTFNILAGGSDVTLEEKSRIVGNINAPGGKVELKKKVRFKGAIYGEEIKVKEKVVFMSHTATTPLSKIAVSAEDDDEAVTVITQYELTQNYPNPFNPSTTIRFALPEGGDVMLRVYNVRGQLVKTLANSNFTSGAHQVVWDGTDISGRQVASGVYVYLLQSRHFSASKKMILVR